MLTAGNTARLGQALGPGLSVLEAPEPAHGNRVWFFSREESPVAS